MMGKPPLLAVTPGEPAGIGPDIVLRLLQNDYLSVLGVDLVIVSNANMLAARAKQLSLPFHAVPWQEPEKSWCPGQCRFVNINMPDSCQPGELNVNNSSYVLETLRVAMEGCLQHQFAGLVTGPVHKGVINDGGCNFSGHTEMLAEITKAEKPVMMLQTDGLRVALVTTHLPLSQVSSAITLNAVQKTCEIVHKDLQKYFGLKNPQLGVCGLNPHAGEGGHLGREEIDIIKPALVRCHEKNIHVHGPLPADTLFNTSHLAQFDCIIAMYHDQGLPVLKHMGFGKAVNITLGLPIIRTSVDHGTALELAGTGKASADSLFAAIKAAAAMIKTGKGGDQ